MSKRASRSWAEGGIPIGAAVRGGAARPNRPFFNAPGRWLEGEVRRLCVQRLKDGGSYCGTERDRQIVSMQAELVLRYAGF